MMATHLVHGGSGIRRGDIVWYRTAFGFSVPAVSVRAPEDDGTMALRPLGFLAIRSATFGDRAPGEWMWRQCDLVEVFGTFQ